MEGTRRESFVSVSQNSKDVSGSTLSFHKNRSYPLKILPYTFCIYSLYLKILLSNDISKYIGCQVIQGKTKRTNFYEVIFKSNKLSSWKVPFLFKSWKNNFIKG